MYSCYQQSRCSNGGVCGNQRDQRRRGKETESKQTESKQTESKQTESKQTIPPMPQQRRHGASKDSEMPSHGATGSAVGRTQQSGGQAALPMPLSFLQRLLPHGSTGDLMALLILLLLLSEGREDSHSTILTLLIFLFL